MNIVHPRFFFCGYHPWTEKKYRNHLFFFFYSSFSKREKIKRTSREKRTLSEWNLECRSPIHPSFASTVFSLLSFCFVPKIRDFKRFWMARASVFLFRIFFGFLSLLRLKHGREGAEDERKKRKRKETRTEEKVELYGCLEGNNGLG